MRDGAKPHAVFVALVEELRAVTPTVVVLEDVHWADEATLDVIRLLARRAEALGALVVVTYRDDELDADAPLRLALGELGTAPGVVAAAPAAALARGRGGARRAARRRRRGALRQDGRQPVLRHGGARRRRTRRCRRPCATRCSRACSRLGAAAQGVLEAVAVVPPHVELWLLDAVVPDEVEHVDACLAAGMLRGEGRTVSFRHELARLAVEQSIGPHRRVVLHAPVLAALRDPPEGAAPDPARLAHHAEAAGDARARARVRAGRRRRAPPRRERTARPRRSTRAHCALPAALPPAELAAPARAPRAASAT